MEHYGSPRMMRDGPCERSTPFGGPHGSFTRDSGLTFFQADGSAPEVLVAAHAPGAHGISLVRFRFARGQHTCGTSSHHLIYITLASDREIACRIDNRRLLHTAKSGNLTVIPQGAYTTAEGGGSIEGLVLIVPTDTLSFAACERSRSPSSLVERLEGEDDTLLGLGRLLSRQVEEGFVDGPLAWYELTEAITQRLVDAHLTTKPEPVRGVLSERALSRVVDCIHAGMDRQLGVAELASAAEQSWSHFPRLFRRSVGISPYQYVIKVRLERALALLRSRTLSVADIATQTGFADQSHMCRWFRRVYGAAPTRFIIALR
jgi:AraC family transcriptional regulator